MQIGIVQIVGALVAIALLIGGAFAAGTKWNSKADISAAAAAAALDSSNASSTDEIAAPIDAPSYKVLRIVDGDTITVEVDGKSQSVRLIGIDTPELNDSRTGVQCFAKEAAAQMTSLLSGKKVRLEKDDSQGERDKYKRLLAYVFREDGVFVNKALIAGGFAHEYTYDTPYKYQAQFTTAEQEAREGEKGLWSEEKCPTTPTKRPAKSTSSNTNANQAAAAAAASAPLQTQPVQQSVQQSQPQLQQPATNTEVPPPSPPPAPPPKQDSPTPSNSSPAPSSVSIVCSTNTYNCTDFKTQKEAQKVYEECGGVQNDVHKLDKNKDGSACDSLP